MENKLPNTIEKLLDKQKKIRFTSKKIITRILITLIAIMLIAFIVIISLLIGGSF